MRDSRLIQFAKQMRSNPTPFEAKLWYHVRAKRFGGAKFRQQQVIGPYIVDFACRIPRKLVIEIDGDTHGDRHAYDQRRTAYLEAQGYQLLRFTNVDVAHNLDGVMAAIDAALNIPLSLALSPEGERENGAM